MKHWRQPPSAVDAFGALSWCVLNSLSGLFLSVSAHPDQASKGPSADSELVQAFQRVPGVVSTATGYSQGHLENPTYEDVCSGSSGHTEVVQVLLCVPLLTITLIAR